MPTFTLAEAETLVAAALIRAKASESNARSVARALVLAEADGLKGHGLSRAAPYAAQSKAGKVDGHAAPVLTRRKPGLVSIDAASGFAYPAIDLAERALPGIVRSQGVAAVAIHRSHHCGAAGHPVERLAEAGFVAILFVNTPSAMAPWGGTMPVLGTNPIAFACPLPGRPPLVIDLSLSKVARSNIVGAKQRGEKIPEGWALDEHGQPTTDPDAAMRGTMVPAGDAKGTALALMVELLAAGLTGANFAAEASSFHDDKGPPPGTGQLIVAFDPSTFGGDAVSRFGFLAQSIETQQGARLPGTRRLKLREKAKAEGLAVSNALLKEIKAI
jgi:(2R)-3-sulfolactate dehydrogenase (NADP+)